MRITQNMLFGQVATGIQTNQQRMFRTQEQLTSGKRINRPSDDAIGSGESVRLQHTLDRVAQFLRNGDQAKSFLDATETSLSAVKSDLDRVEELVMQQLSGTQGDDGRQAAIAELQQLRAAALQSMNVKQEGRFVFAGFQTQTQPFDASGAFQGTSGQSLETEIGDGDFVGMNLTGDAAFVDPSTGHSPVQLIDNLIASLQADDLDGLRAQLPEISDLSTRVTDALSDVGARQNRLETAASDNQTLREVTTGVLSQIQDTDYATASTAFAQEQQVLQATLASSTQLVQTSILNFLK